MRVNSHLFVWLDLHSTVRKTYDLGRGVFSFFKNTEGASDENEVLTTLFQTQMAQIPLSRFILTSMVSNCFLLTGTY